MTQPSLSQLKDHVLDLYVHQEMSLKKIAKHLNISLELVRTLVSVPDIENLLKFKDLSKHDQQLIARDYENGMSIRELVKKHNVNRGAIWWVLKKLKVNLRPSQKYVIDFDLVKSLYEKGHSVPQIAQILNVGVPNLYERMRKRGIPTQRKHLLKPEYIPAILDRHQRGIPLNIIASEFGVCAQTFKKFLQKYDSFPVDKCKTIKFFT